MLIIGPWGFLAIALVVFVVWRLVCRRRAGGGRVREFVVATLFIYLLAVACITFFPMNIIFYDWHGRFNLVPFASIIDLVQHQTSAVVKLNIGGNIGMFVPLGLLLPLLFRKLRSLGPLVWRVAFISLGIELLQMVTRVRSTDVDDIILNVTGAVVGYGLFRLISLLATRNQRTAAFLDRVGSERGPLLEILAPVVLTIMLTLALIIVPKVMTNTLDENAIREDAVSGMAGASVVARAEEGGHVFLVAGSQDGVAKIYRRVEYKLVLPGRYTKISWEEVEQGAGSSYMLSCTDEDTLVGTRQVTYLYGKNDAGASALIVSAKGMTANFEAPIGDYFVVPLPTGDFEYYYTNATFTFRDASGRDVTGSFKYLNDSANATLE